MIYTFKNIKIKIFVLLLLVLGFFPINSYAQTSPQNNLSNLMIGNIDVTDTTVLIPDSIPTLPATFIKLPDSVMATNSNSVLAGIKAGFSVSAEALPAASRKFDDSITLTDSSGLSFNIMVDIVNVHIDYPDAPNTDFLFNTDIIPPQVSEGSGTILLKSNGSSVARVNVFVVKSDALGTDANDPRNPQLRFFKLRRHKNAVRLIIRGKNFYNVDETSFTTVPSTSIKKFKIRSNKKGRSKMIVTFDLNDRSLSRILFSITTPFGQVLEKVRLRDLSYRKPKHH